MILIYIDNEWHLHVFQPALIVLIDQTFNAKYLNLLHRDDTPHVPNEDLGEEKVVGIIANLTHIIKTLFPSMYGQ